MSAELIDDLRTVTRRALDAGAGDVVDQLDLTGLLVDAERGGLGLGDREMVVVATELGRALSPSAFLPAAVLAATVLTHCDSGAAAEVMAALVAGDTHCAVAIADASWTTSTSPVVATPTADGGWLLAGTVCGLSAPSHPDTLLIVAAVDHGAALFTLAANDVEIAPADQLDPARGLITVALSHAPARLIADPGTAPVAIAAAYRRGLLAVSAEQLGVARTCLEKAVDHAKTRSQFGSPIGSFQAIKHRCAEVLLDVELADAVLDEAVQTGASNDAELASIVSGRAAIAAAESCIHIHGGSGFTWEHFAHRYLRRARVNTALMGAPGMHRDAIARSCGLIDPAGL